MGGGPHNFKSGSDRACTFLFNGLHSLSVKFPYSESFLDYDQGAEDHVILLCPTLTAAGCSLAFYGLSLFLFISDNNCSNLGRKKKNP